MKPRRSRQTASQEPFRLPPDISMEKEILADGAAYVFRHRELRILGRIRLHERGAGGSHLVYETAGDPADPATARRAEIFEPLGRAIAAMFPTDAAAVARGERPPPAPFDPGQWVRTQQINCTECGEAAAYVTFAVDGTDHGRLEDCARRMYPQHAASNLPAWIIGPARGSRQRGRGVADVLPAWPVRGPVVAMTGNQFDAMLDSLVDGHCRDL